MLSIPPELDFTSEHFDPSKALSVKNIYLPYPKAKTYNNLADWYSHTFKKEMNVSSKQGSLKATKNECFVLKRNYEWYYETLGLDLPDNFDIQSRFQKYTKRKRNSYGKYQVDKKVVVKEMPPDMLKPIQSSKILVKKSDGSLRDYIYVNEDGTISNDETTEKNFNVKNKSCWKVKHYLKKAASDSAERHSNIPSSKTVAPEFHVTPPEETNNISNVECRSLEKVPQESCSKTSVSPSPTVLLNLINKNSQNDKLTKDLALLELAGRARKKLHVKT